MRGCLEGIKVLELGNFISGPYGAMLLADMGAEVIKVENPKGGDPFRGWDLGGDQPNFWAYNRGKRSITLNLQMPEGKEIFLALAKSADQRFPNCQSFVNALEKAMSAHAAEWDSTLVVEQPRNVSFLAKLRRWIGLR